MSTSKNRFDLISLEDKHGPMTMGLFLKAFRLSEAISQTKFAKMLKISKANLCDIEKARKHVSPERAARFAKILKVPESALIQLTLQDYLRMAHLNYKVQIQKAS